MKTTISADAALEKIRQDHRRVLDLFALFEAEDDAALRVEIGREAVNAITMHALLEETLFYPVIAAATGERRLVAAAREEHDYAKTLIAELKTLKPGAGYDHVFRTLIGVIRAHIQSEEGVLLPLVESEGIDLGRMGRQAAQSLKGGSGAGLLALSLGLGAAALYGLSQRRSSQSRP